MIMWQNLVIDLQQFNSVKGNNSARYKSDAFEWLNPLINRRKVEGFVMDENEDVEGAIRQNRRIIYSKGVIVAKLGEILN
jgi:hypothetical protein